MKTQYWRARTFKTDRLNSDIQCNLLIVGAGVLGLTLAYVLSRAGVRDIVVVEKGQVGGGATGHSAGMLVAELETADLSRFARAYGKKRSRLWLDAHVDALNLLCTIVRDEHIICDLEKRPLHYFADTAPREEILIRDIQARRSLHQRATKLTMDDVQREVRTPYYHTGSNVRSGYSVNPLALVRGLARVVQKGGVRIFQHAEVIRITAKTAQTERHTITFTKAVVATDIELGKSVRTVLTTIAVTQPLRKKEIRGFKLNDGDMFIDFGKRSFHYGKILPDRRILLGYGDREVHPSKAHARPHQPHVRVLRTYAQKLFPKPLSLAYAWSWPFALSRKYLPVIHRRRNVFFVGGAGIQVGSVLIAQYVAYAILGKRHKLDIFFS